MKKSGLEHRGLVLSKVAANKPHGNRVRYMNGCRCVPCRAANSQYEVARSAARRAGDWNGLVPAKAARRHILKLSRQGVGRRALVDVSGVADSLVSKIKNGKKQQIRKRTEIRILAVSARAVSGGAKVPATRTWRFINLLLGEGFTKADIALKLGRKTPALQIRKDRVTAKTAADVERLYNLVMQ